MPIAAITTACASTTKDVFCLCLDLVASTQASFRRSSADVPRFNLALVRHLQPYLDAAQLERAVVKFGGDGWLILSPDHRDARRLCAMAVALAQRFVPQMQMLLGRGVFVPPLRIALCRGADREVVTPTGMPDWVGESARSASRAASCCPTAKVVIDGAVHGEFRGDLHNPGTLAVDRRGTGRGCELPDALFTVDNLSGGASRDIAKLFGKLLNLKYDRLPMQEAGASAAVPRHRGSEFEPEFAVQVGSYRDPAQPPLHVRIRPPRQDLDLWSPPPVVAREVWEALAEAFALAKAHDREITYKPLGRVRDWNVSRGHVVLDLQYTFYALFAATNLAMQHADDPAARQFHERIKELSSGEVLAKQVFLASPLNAIAALISSDNTLLLPWRSERCFERPNTFQASVGGAWEVEDGVDPFRIVVRETREELGIRIARKHIRFIAFGYSELTGEPDLLAIIRSTLSAADIQARYAAMEAALRRKRGHAPEVLLLPRKHRFRSVWRLDEPRELKELGKQWQEREIWSQPSDRAVVLAAVLRHVGWKRVGPAFGVRP